jgi:hypothetical protein
VGKYVGYAVSVVGKYVGENVSMVVSSGDGIGSGVDDTLSCACAWIIPKARAMHSMKQ